MNGFRRNDYAAHSERKIGRSANRRALFWIVFVSRICGKTFANIFVHRPGRSQSESEEEEEEEEEEGSGAWARGAGGGKEPGGKGGWGGR